MIEVFKTNIESESHAEEIISAIHCFFKNSTANFDLEDCDKILRIKSVHEHIESSNMIVFLANYGCDAIILNDD
jgi:hypothetical protein